MAKGVALLFATVAPGEGDAEAKTAPRMFTLFKWGWNTTQNPDRTGRSDFLFDREAADQVMAAYESRQIILKGDYEHQSLQRPPIIAPASCSSFKLRLSDEGLQAYDVEWTERAAAMIVAKEYGYFSPAVRYDEETRRVTRLINFGLTNLPAMDDIQPLMAATNRRFLEEEDMSAKTIEELTKENTELSAKLVRLEGRGDQEAIATLSAAIGLEPTATLSAKASAIATLVASQREVLAATGAKSHAEAIGTIHGWKAASLRVAELTELDEKREEKSMLSELDAIFAKGDADRKIAPAEVATLRAMAMPDGKVTRDGITKLTAYVAVKPQVAATKVVTSEGGTAVLSASESKYAARFNVDPKELAAFSAGFSGNG